ncbi:hypothetical protein ACQY0O_001168 [Thecaphora frezii]
MNPNATNRGSRSVELYSSAVAGLGAVFFLLAAYKQASASLATRRRSTDRLGSHPSFTTGDASAKRLPASGAQRGPERSTSASSATSQRCNHGVSEQPLTRGKTTDQSTVQVTYPTTWDMCDAGAHPDAHEALVAGSEGSASGGPHLLPLRTLQKVRAGALLRLIDVVAGVTARKHAESSCVTISVDSVLLLKPVYLGELVHLSASVNRAWGSSMEVGVRVVKEDPVSGEKAYVSHSYLTFVAVARPAAGASANQPPARIRLASRTPSAAVSEIKQRGFLGWLGSFGNSLFTAPPSTASCSSTSGASSSKVQLQPVIPQTPLEARRHILAGRRRTKRIDNAKRGEARDGVSTAVKRMLKEEVLEMSRVGGRKEVGLGINGMEDKATAARSRLVFEDGDIRVVGDRSGGLAQGKTQQDIELDALELEFVVEAYVDNDPAVKLRQDKGVVEIHLPGDVPLRHPLEVVKRLAQQLRRQRQQAEDDVLPAQRSKDATAAPASPTAEAAAVAPSVASASPVLVNEVPGLMAAPAMARKVSVFSPLCDSLENEEGAAAESGWHAPRAAEEDGWTERNGAITLAPDATAIATVEAAKTQTPSGRGSSDASREAGQPRSIEVAKTLARTLHLVFPEHTNSVSVLFGGQLMDWMEEAALLAVRHVGRGRRWSTVGLDGLEFEQAVGIGEVMTFTAIAVRTFRQSCEVYVLAEAESPNGTRRITNDALFTLAFPFEADEVAQGRQGIEGAAEGERMLRQVEMPSGSALETFAQVAPQRRKARLEMRDMLNRIYVTPL